MNNGTFLSKIGEMLLNILNFISGKEKGSQATQSQSRDSSEFAEAQVDIKKFSQFLNSQQVNPTRVICSK